MRTDLVERLRAVLDEADRVAKAARSGRWHVTEERDLVVAEWASGPRRVARCEGSIPTGNAHNAAYIIAWQPDVALRMVEATREVLERHKPTGLYDMCSWCNSDRHYQPSPCPDVLTEAKRWGVEP